MSIVDYFEDEDIIVKNSPLHQYLNDINIENIKIDDKEDYKLNGHHSYKCQWILIKKIFIFLNYIKKFFLTKGIGHLLKYALNMNVLNEEDELCLQYLIDTRLVQWDNVEIEFTFERKVTLLIWVFLGLCSTRFLGIVVTFTALVCICLVWLILLLLSSHAAHYLTLALFDRMVTISRQSRQIILMIQELLSINQGFARLVHIKEAERYDSSRSFNVTFVHKLTTEIFTLLLDILTQSHTWNVELQEHFVSERPYPPEIPWWEEKIDRSPPFLHDGDIDLTHPLTELKMLHNLIQLQFSFSVKRTVLWLFTFSHQPCLKMPISLYKFSSRCSALLSRLDRCTKILPYMTQSHLSRNQKGYQESDTKCALISSSIRSMQLHLFEISQFTSLISAGLDRGVSRDQFLGSESSAIQKCRMHLDSLYSCWHSINNELLNGFEKGTTLSVRPSVTPQSSTETEGNEGRVVDGDVDVIDEVLEGVPLEPGDTDRDRHAYSELDTFAEKSKSNANCLLNELKSVIEVRAEDWRKREKMALERRAAEGKFVFGEECRHLEVSPSNKSARADEVKEEKSPEVASNLFGGDMDLGFRMSLGQMILRQRKSMLLESNTEFEFEEHFSD